MEDLDPIALGLIIGIVFAGVMIVHVLSNISNILKEMEAKETIKIDCPPHAWEYVPIPGTIDQIYMVCSKCKFRAGGE